MSLSNRTLRFFKALRIKLYISELKDESLQPICAPCNDVRCWTPICSLISLLWYPWDKQGLWNYVCLIPQHTDKIKLNTHCTIILNISELNVSADVTVQSRTEYMTRTYIRFINLNWPLESYKSKHDQCPSDCMYL